MKPAWRYQPSKNSQLFAIPLIVSALFLAFFLAQGVPLSRDFKGGSLIMVEGLENVPSSNSVESAAKGLFGTNIDVVFIENGFHIETEMLDENDETDLKEVFSAQLGITADSIIVESMGPISDIQSEQVLYSIIAALVAIGIITFIIFKRRIAPITILLVMGLDILCVLGYMALFRVPLGIASTVGIVMLIGFAVDTNVLLAWRVIKRVGGEPREQVTSSLYTGMLMSVTAVVILLILNIVTSAQQLNVLTAVLIFGVAINILNTWLLGAGILLRYAERQPRKEYHVSL